VRYKFYRYSVLFMLACLALWMAQPGLYPVGAKVISTRAAGPTATMSKAEIASAYGKLPLSFEPNHGQADAAARFLTRGAGYQLLLTHKGAELRLQGAVRPAVVSMQLVNASPAPRMSGVGELPGKVNYFRGRPTDWLTNLPTYRAVEYESLYPGVRLQFYGRQQQLEYDFILEAGADPSVIKLKFTGAQRLRLRPDGHLALQTAAGEIIQHRPIAYQETAEGRRPVAARYVIDRRRRVSFALGAYDKTRPLVIANRKES